MMKVDFGGGEDVAFFRQGYAGIIRLTRARALNCLNQTMINAIARALERWAQTPDVALVLIEGEGRAFCAGGDVVQVWRHLNTGGDARPFFAAEYRLNSLMGHFPKPCISFLDGFVMGGGAGLSMHGSYRIVTENTYFAMPEAAIGFFPDVGISPILARMEGHFGLYLALTGVQIGGGDCLQLGLATHAIESSAWPALRQNLIEYGKLELLDKAHQNIDVESTAAERTLIEACFCAPDVAEIIKRLKQYSGGEEDFAARTADTLLAHSPTSLKIILKHQELARPLTLDECLKLDYHLACQMLEHGDFREGVRARLIDKDNKPHWQPARLEDVDQERVAAYFTTREDELEL